MTEASTLTIRMSFGLWKGIDAGMDNKTQQAMWEHWDGGGEIGDVANPDVGPIARFAGGIREEGWRQFPDDSQSLDEQVDMSLTREQWEFIVVEARDSLPIYQELAQSSESQPRQDMLASAELSREIISVVNAALDAAEGDHR